MVKVPESYNQAAADEEENASQQNKTGNEVGNDDETWISSSKVFLFLLLQSLSAVSNYQMTSKKGWDT